MAFIAHQWQRLSCMKMEHFQSDKKCHCWVPFWLKWVDTQHWHHGRLFMVCSFVVPCTPRNNWAWPCETCWPSDDIMPYRRCLGECGSADRRRRRRSEVAWKPSTSCNRSGLGESPPGRSKRIDCSSSDPCWASVWPDTVDPSHCSWWGLGPMDGDIALRGHEGCTHTGPSPSFSYTGSKAEDDPHFGSRRRWRLHCRGARA